MSKTSPEKAELRLPLPADVDVSDMPHIPLFDDRLLKSRAWLRARNWRGEGPGLGFCLINLFSRAFRDVPGGSIEDDDDVLADAARCDIAHWGSIRERALTGWILAAGRWHHPVISQIVWDLWQMRLVRRHENAVDSWRAACKRKADKGHEMPDPPGPMMEWRAANYPATHAYIGATSPGHPPDVAPTSERQSEMSDRRRGDKQENPTDLSPKRSKAKGESPLCPPMAAVGPAAGQGMGDEAASRKRWFGQELARLECEFGAMADVMKMNLQSRHARGKFGLVQTFKGAFLDPGGAGGPAIVMPSKRRADAVVATHGEWLRHYWPALTVRHAKVDELRAFKGRKSH